MADHGRVVVVGQGYVGLPLAVVAASAGWHVTGVDTDHRRVAELNSGRSPWRGDVRDEDIAELVRTGRYAASASYDDVKSADVVVICVPTPVRDETPDLSHVEEAGRQISTRVTAGTLVILESTTYPGTTEEVLLPLLLAGSGLDEADLDVSFSPERVDPGNAEYGLTNTPKIVGGRTPRALERAVGFYATFVERVVPVSSPATAEMAKLLENTFRHINIALANEMAVLCRELGLDVWEVIDAAGTKPFGFMPFYPGPGVGGHCIPVDPMYLSWKVRQTGATSRFISLARDINAAMPAYVVARVQGLLNDVGKPVKDSKILAVGVTYKANTGDLRGSPALDVLAGLARLGADIAFSDPFVAQLEVAGRVLRHVALEAAAADADCVVLLAAHQGVDHERLARAATLVLDTRHAVRSTLSHVHSL